MTARRDPLMAICHCGAVAVALIRRPKQLTECNCSICRRYGARWAYYAAASVQLPDIADMEVYAWGNGIRRFHRCRTCGCVMFHRRSSGTSDRVAINANMLPPEAIETAPVRTYDGARSVLR